MCTSSRPLLARPFCNVHQHTRATGSSWKTIAFQVYGHIKGSIFVGGWVGIFYPAFTAFFFSEPQLWPLGLLRYYYMIPPSIRSSVNMGKFCTKLQIWYIHTLCQPLGKFCYLKSLWRTFSDLWPKVKCKCKWLYMSSLIWPPGPQEQSIWTLLWLYQQWPWPIFEGHRGAGLFWTLHPRTKDFCLSNWWTNC